MMNRLHSLFSCVAVAAAIALLSSCDSSSSSDGSDGGKAPVADGGASGSNGGTWSKSDFGIPWNGSIAYGTVVDSRDGQVYRTVKIGTQTWMAENLNYRKAAGGSDTVGVCVGKSVDSCSKYGRLYTWTEVMGGSTSSNARPSGVKGICPTDWHVPSDAEWQLLEIAVGMSNSDTALTYMDRGYSEGTKLKATQGWSYSGISANGTDDFGLRMLPAGGILGGSSEEYPDRWTAFWTTSEGYERNAWNRYLHGSARKIGRIYGAKSTTLSLRCLRD